MKDISRTEETYEETFYEGFWSFRNQEIEVLMDKASFDTCLKAYLMSQGIDPRSSDELLEEAAKRDQQYFEAERVLFNPDYWRQINDPHIRIIPLRQTPHPAEVDNTP
jgi:hypothetical protein